MLRRIARILLIVTALAAVVVPADAGAASLWEFASQLSARDIERVDDTGMDIAVRDGVVTLTLSRPTQVRVLTILGQPLSQETLQAGVHRLRLSARGIYILRVGSVTRRITV